MMRWIKRLVWAVLLVALALMTYSLLQPEPVAVEVAEVGKGPLQVTIEEQGKTRVRDRFVVSAPVQGKLKRILLEPGDAVRAGKTLLAIVEPADPVLLDPRTVNELQARVRTAQANLELAESREVTLQAQLRYAQSEVRRLRLLEPGLHISQQAMEAAETEQQSLQSQLRSAEKATQVARFELEQARAALRQFQGRVQNGSQFQPVRLYSPVDGSVLEVMQKSETVVTPGTPLVKVGDPARLEVVADLLSSDAVKVRRGAEVTIEQWGGETQLQGRVRLVEPSGFTKISALGVEEQRVNVIIDPAQPLEDWARLGDGYRVEVHIVVWENEEVLQVPLSALFRSSNQWNVFVNRQGTAELRAVEIGHRSLLKAEVLSGLEAGEEVIVHPPEELESGRKIEALTTRDSAP